MMREDEETQNGSNIGSESGIYSKEQRHGRTKNEEM